MHLAREFLGECVQRRCCGGVSCTCKDCGIVAGGKGGDEPKT